ncbi:MAG: tyrosine--tRNA ligase [Chloroflexi bacterium RBG_16_64_43]|nr:MAG: tyrosine--tRNA ligase [Chloroflexi bacterium RBG_16_64_43]
MPLSIDEQVTLLMQGTEYGDAQVQRAMAEELRERLGLAARERRPLRIYCGYDPTTADLHLGHTVTMRKLRQFQDLGHQAIFLIGDYTARVGDPSDKDKLRPQLSQAQIEANGRTYAEQAYRILDRERTEVRHNSEWLSTLTFAEMIRLASNFTLQQFVTRDNFRLRWERGDAVYLHETFYAVMQGYDAYSLQADVQVGGSEQLFNILTAARKVMEYLGARPNVGVLTGILPGTDGVVRMSKSLGNHIPLLAGADDMYGKVMSLPDTAMPVYMRLLSRWSPGEIQRLEADLAGGGVHPRDVKMSLAREVVSIFHGEASAELAEDAFRRVFQQSDLPESMTEMVVEGSPRLVDWMAENGLARSRSEARRLIEQGGVKLDGAGVGDTDVTLDLTHDAVLQVGKRRFVRLTRIAR